MGKNPLEMILGLLSTVLLVPYCTVHELLTRLSLRPAATRQRRCGALPHCLRCGRRSARRRVAAI